jgi:hypothetical protein
MSKKKDGTVTKSEAISIKEIDKEAAIKRVTKQAKERYVYKGKVHIGSVFIRNQRKEFEKI